MKEYGLAFHNLGQGFTFNVYMPGENERRNVMEATEVDSHP